MSKKNIGHNFVNLSSDLKKEILQSLVASLLDGLNEEEQKDILHAALTTQKKSRELIDMVAHGLKECADSGVSPVEMSKEVLSTISHSCELATYSTTELSELFEDWLSEIEKEALVFLKGRSTAEPEMVAQHLRLEQESAKFILDKLDREGRIDLDNKLKGESWNLKIRYNTIALMNFDFTAEKGFKKMGKRGVMVEIIAKKKGCMMCDLAIAILEEIAPEFSPGSLQWQVVDVGSRQGLLRQEALTRICGRRPAVPSIVMDERIAFDHIPDMEALSNAVREATDASSLGGPRYLYKPFDRLEKPTNKKEEQHEGKRCS